MLFFHFWPIFLPSQCCLSQLTHQILHTNIGRARRKQSVPIFLTQAAVAQEQKRGTRGYWILLRPKHTMLKVVMIFACPRTLMSALRNGYGYTVVSKLLLKSSVHRMMLTIICFAFFIPSAYIETWQPGMF